MSAEIQVVEWTDTTFCYEDAPGLSECLTVGFVIEEDEDSILLAMERHLIDGEIQYRVFNRIPKVCLR